MGPTHDRDPSAPRPTAGRRRAGRGLYEPVALADCLIRLMIVVLLLRMAGLKATHRWVSGRRSVTAHGPRHRPHPEAGRSAWRIAGLARRLPIQGTCLQRSLTLVWRLQALGMPAELRIGVAKAAGFAAHAWVEVDDTPVAESDAINRRFRAFPSQELNAACSVMRSGTSPR